MYMCSPQGEVYICSTMSTDYRQNHVDIYLQVTGCRHGIPGYSPPVTSNGLAVAGSSPHETTSHVQPTIGLIIPSATDFSYLLWAGYHDCP